MKTIFNVFSYNAVLGLDSNLSPSRQRKDVPTTVLHDSRGFLVTQHVLATMQCCVPSVEVLLVFIIKPGLDDTLVVTQGGWLTLLTDSMCFY